MGAKRRVLIVFPTAWDRRQLASCRAAWEDRFELVWAEPGDEETPADLDVLGFVERAVEAHRGRIDGVFSSSDYPGATVAAAIATRLGLPGSTPDAVIRTSHKHASRLTQRAAVPEATPAFDLVPYASWDGRLAVGFPCFVKPVKGAFSVLARRVGSADELREFLARPAVREFMEDYLDLFHALVRALSTCEHDGRHFVAEELLHGDMVTVEGFLQGGEVELLGIVDSGLHPRTRSFTRFDLPSRLPPAVQERMADVVRRALRASGLEATLFNVELMHEPESGRVSIVEINPRICGQFADLYAKVDGSSSYALALELCTGGRPRPARRAGAFGAAASFPLRVYEPSRVLRSPSEAEVRALERDEPGTLVWNECAAGDELVDFEHLEDGASARYAIVNLGAQERGALDAQLERVRRRLGWAFGPAAPGGNPGVAGRA